MPKGRQRKNKNQDYSYLAKLSGQSGQADSSQSKLSMVLGALIILVVGVLIYNYFTKSNGSLGPAQQTETTEQVDVTAENLPGKYTVKKEDTLFLIAEKYYKDGFKFSEIAKANNIVNVDSIETGQVLEIPKLAEEIAQTDTGTGGGDTTIWGAKITGDVYTVAEGDWLSTIAARAYGDIMAYPKIAEANNIANPDLILPGQVLKLPR